MLKPESDYVPLNNLEEFADPEVSNPYTGLLDEPPTEPTLDEIYAGADAATLRQLTYETFWEGVRDYLNRWREYKPDRDSRFSAEQKLVLDSARFVTHMVRKEYSGPTYRLNLLDRVQTGQLNLVKAASRRKPDKAGRLGVSTKPHMIATVKEVEKLGRGGLNQGDVIKIVSDDSAYYRVRNLLEALSTKYGRDISLDEALEITDLTPEDAREYKDRHIEYLPFHEVFAPDSGRDIVADPDTHEPERIMDNVQLMTEIGRALTSRYIDDRQRYILVARNGLDGQGPREQQEIGDELGVTGGRVFQLETKGLKKMRLILGSAEWMPTKK